MIKFRQTNQQFRTIDLMGMLILFGIVTSSVGALLAEAINDTRPARAKAAAEAYALQLRFQHEKSHKESSTKGREPASSEPLRSGAIGKDPWGQPFHYKVQSLAGSETQKIIVWSDGPDRRADSVAVLENPLSSAAVKNFRFLGDDVGFIQDFVLQP